MQMVINLAPASLSNKKVNFYTYPKLTFLKKNAMGNADKGIYEPVDFKIFWRGACPHTPLAARTFGARILPPLVLKSGYGPGYIFIFTACLLKKGACITGITVLLFRIIFLASKGKYEAE